MHSVAVTDVVLVIIKIMKCRLYRPAMTWRAKFNWNKCFILPFLSSSCSPSSLYVTFKMPLSLVVVFQFWWWSCVCVVKNITIYSVQKLIDLAVGGWLNAWTATKLKTRQTQKHHTAKHQTLLFSAYRMALTEIVTLNKIRRKENPLLPQKWHKRQSSSEKIYLPCTCSHTLSNLNMQKKKKSSMWWVAKSRMHSII